MGYAALQTARGVVATIGSVVTLGLIRKINEQADCTSYSWLLGVIPYRAVARVINPNPKGHADGDGLTFTLVAGRFYSRALHASYSGNFFEKHVVSRLSYGVGAIFAIPTRITDFMLGAGFALISLVPFFGRIEAINTYALKHLASTKLLDDLARSIRGFVNPGQFTGIV